MRRIRVLVSATTVGLLLASLLAAPALAAVSISRAELSGSKLRVEGAGATPTTTVTVNGGQASATSDGAGNFRIEGTGFAAPADCRVTVSDGTSSTSATLSGCTAAAPAPPPATAPSLSSLTVSPTDILGTSGATGTVTLTAAAPAGGFVVALTSDNTAAATVPPSVSVAAGATRATFPVTTNNLTNAQSAIIIGTAAGVTRHAVITVWDALHFSSGSVAILPGGTGSGRITSQPAGIDCTITRGNGSGACSVFFPVGTVVRLDARPAADSSFLGWRGLPGCSDASKISIARGTTITCQPALVLR